MFSFLKKKKEEAKDESAEDDAEEEAAPAPEAGGDGGAGNAQLMAQIGTLQADVSKINAQLDSAKEIRKANAERFSTINEQIGELRGSINETNRTVGMIEVKSTKAADLVESVQPDKLMIEVQKVDGKVEGLKGNLEANEEMMKNIMEQLKGMRNQMGVFRGLEQVIKMSEETKQEVMNMKRVAAMVEGHSDKVENIFAEMQKSFKEFGDFVASLDQLKTALQDQSEKIGKIEVKVETFVQKKDFEKRIAGFDSQDKKIRKLLKSLQEEREDFMDQYAKKIYKLELVSEAYQNLIDTNPVFANELDISKYMKVQVNKKESEDDEDSEDKSKDAENSEGGDKKEGEAAEGEKKEGEGGEKKKGDAAEGGKDGEKKEADAAGEEEKKREEKK